MDNESQNDEWDLEEELLSGVSSEALLNDDDDDDIDVSLSSNVLEKENIKESKEDCSESTLASNNDTEKIPNSFGAVNNKKCDNGNDLKESESYKIKKGKSTKFKDYSNLLEKKAKVNNKKNNIHFPVKEWHKTKKTKLVKFKNSSVLPKKKIKISKKNGTRFPNKATNSSYSNNIPSLLSLDTKLFNIKQAFKVPNVSESSLPSLLHSLPEYWPSKGVARNVDTQKLNNQAGFKKYEQTSTRYCDQKHLGDTTLPINNMNSFSNSFSCNRAENFVCSEASNLFNDSGTGVSDNYNMNQNVYNDHSNSSPLLNIITNDFRHYRNKNMKSNQLYATPNWQNKEDFTNDFTNSAIVEDEFRRNELAQNNEQVRMKKKRKRKNVFLKKSLQLSNLTLTNNIIEGQKKNKSLNALHNLNKQEQETFEVDDLGTHWIDKKYIVEMEEERSKRISGKQVKVLNSKEILILDNKEIFAQKSDKPCFFHGDVDVKKIANLRRVPEVEIIDEVNPFANLESWKSSIYGASDLEKTWSHLNGSIVKIRNLPSGMTIKDISLLCLPVGKPIETKLYFPRENAASIRFRERSTAENFYKLFHNREIHENILEVIIV